MTKKIDIPGLVELLRQKKHRIIMDVAESLFGHDLAVIEAELHRRLDGSGTSAAEITEWAQIISESQPPR